MRYISTLPDTIITITTIKYPVIFIFDICSVKSKVNTSCIAELKFLACCAVAARGDKN